VNNSISFLLIVTLAIAFVFTPLGFYAWFGLSEEYFLFHQGYWPVSLILIALFHALCLFVLIKLVKAKKKWTAVMVVFGIWLFGLLGLLRFLSVFTAKYEKSRTEINAHYERSSEATIPRLPPEKSAPLNP